MGAHATSLNVLSTEGIRASERREFWESSATPLFGRLELEWESRQSFRASCEYANIADLVLCKLSTSVPHRITRTETVLRHDGRGYVKAVFQTKGCTVVEQGARRAVLRPGRWSVYDGDQSYRVTIPNWAEMYVVMIPRGRILTRDVNFQSLVLRLLSSRHGFGKLIWSLISATFDQISEIQSHSCHDVADIMAQMVHLALSDFSKEHAAGDSREVLRVRLKSYIASHLSDPDLSITRLARVTGCTKRYLHMIFEPEDVSISDYIRKLRLDRCRQDLLNPACAQRSITDIAYSWGFNNSNHFSRCFRDEFGRAPRDSRAEFAGRLIEPRKSA
jgi:AraC-like DNA-binding protein